MNPTGRKTAKQRQGRGHDRQADFARPFDGRLKRRHSFLFNETKNVFQHHDRVVDHDADHQRQRQHRDLIEREAHRRHQTKRGNQRGRNRQGRDHRRPEAPEKDEDDDGREYAAFDQVRLN